MADPGLHRTLLGDGLATSLAGFLGGPANTTYGENTGVLELSRVHDPRVIRIAAVFAIIVSFIPQRPITIISGVRFPINIAITCCNPSGMACERGILPSKS